jgi:hypothetical protein
MCTYGDIMRTDIIAHILSETNTFSANPLAQFQVEGEEGEYQGQFIIDGHDILEDTTPPTKEDSIDIELLLAKGLDLHEVQVTTLALALKYQKAKDKNVKGMNQLYTRWNEFLTTEKYDNLSAGQKSTLWEKYKTQLSGFKTRNQKAKPFVSNAWDSYFQAKEEFSSHMGSAEGLWSAFYNLLSDESQAASYFTRMGETWQEESEILTSEDAIQSSKDRELNEREEEEVLLNSIGVNDTEEEEFTEIMSIASELGL